MQIQGLRWLLMPTLALSLFGCELLSEKKTELDEPISLDIPTQTASTTTAAQANLSEHDVDEALAYQNNALWQKPVSVQLDGMPFLDALEGLSQLNGFDYAIDHSMDVKVRYMGKNVKLYLLLESLARQGEAKIHWDENHVRFTQDRPYWKNHRVPQLNMQRDSKSRVSLSQNVGKQDLAEIGTQVDNVFEHHFWQNLTVNLQKLLESTDSDHLVINKEAGIVSSYANESKQQNIKQFLKEVINNQQKQVVIEVSILEVELSKSHQQGIDWRLMSGQLSLAQNVLNNRINTAPNGVISITGSGADSGSLAARFLQQFGDSKVISSPRIQVLNNHTALLKVVDNAVYFTIESVTSVNQNGSVTNFDTELNSVAVGLILALTPYIQQNGEILLNLRPTISSVSGMVRDPHPVLAQQGVVSQVPIIQERELESVLRVKNGELAVIGGLIQKRRGFSNDGLIGLSALGYKQNTARNTELVLFIRPTILP